MKALVAILLIACIGLTAALLVRHNKAMEQQKADEAIKIELTNRLEKAQARFDEQERMNMFLQTNLTMSKQEFSSVSNRLVNVSRTLEQTKADAEAAAAAAQEEINKRESRINELSAQGEDLSKRIASLNGSISNLNGLIAETERKLSAAEGDREFLLKELKRLQAEKAELERQFNDLDLLRAQVSKLKDELSVARRLEWIRRGIYGTEVKKGAEMLMRGITAPTPRTNFNLNVELRQDGGATVVPPATNAPANGTAPVPAPDK